MREILFRGKRKDNGEWVEGFFILAEDIYTPDNEITSFIVEKDTAYFGYNEFSGAMRVIPETVGQYTGLTDKNGKKIFEGDILHYKHPLYKFEQANGVVKFGEFSTPYAKKIIGFYIDWEYTKIIGMFTDLEIIGNIHDNPELLEADNGRK